MEQGANLSTDLKYRYKLWRIWDRSKPLIMFVMLNPSTADAQNDDATIKKLIKFAQSWGYGGFYVCNLYAFRATKPDDVIAAAKQGLDVIGEGNLNIILNTAPLCAGGVVLAWGAICNKIVQGQAAKVRQNLMEYGHKLYELKRTKEGHPQHPLYIADSTRPTPIN